MKHGSTTDTEPDARRVHIELMRRAPAWRKLQLADRLHQTVRLLALAGLRNRHPGASEQELRRRLADLILGPEVAERLRPADEEPVMALPEPIAVTLRVVEVLERLGVRYAIGGSLASSVHGVFRASVGADVIAGLRLEHVEPLARELRETFYLDEEAIRRAIDARRGFNLIHLETMFKVDVFIPRGRAFDEAQLERRTAHIIATDPERAAFVASAEDTILAKLDWYRAGGKVSEQQWRDVLGILQVQRGRLDLGYLRRLAASLDVSDLLDRALTAADG